MQMLEAEDSMRAKAWTWVEVGSGQQQGAPGVQGGGRSRGEQGRRWATALTLSAGEQRAGAVKVLWKK